MEETTSARPADSPDAAPLSPAADSVDNRLYLPDTGDWEACIKRDSDKIYCYQKSPGQDYYHLILSGEIFLKNGNEKLCLACALRRGVVTHDRLHWQHRVKRVTAPPL